MPEIRALFEQFGDREMVNRIRRALRAGIKVIRTHMRSEARSRSDLPKTFAKTRTRAHRDPLGVSVSPGSLLSNIFEGGARSHPIATRKARLLAGPAGERSRGRAFVARGPVSHPGMRARPFIGPVFAASKNEATREIERVLFEGV